MRFHPGSAWNYSIATDVCGYLVQVLSDMPFEDFLQQRIFSPLGMVDTGFHVPPDKVDRFAKLYQHNPETAHSMNTWARRIFPGTTTPNLQARHQGAAV